MWKKEIVASLMLVGLFAAFAAVSAIVVLTRSDPRWIQRKIKIGLLIMSFSSLLSGCDSGGMRGGPGAGPGYVSCYDPIAVTDVEIDQFNTSSQQYVVDLRVSNIFSGTLVNRDAEIYSFRLTDESGREYQSANLAALDGAMDSPSERFEISIQKDLPGGSYLIQFFEVDAGSQSTSVPFLTLPIAVLGV